MSSADVATSTRDPEASISHVAGSPVSPVSPVKKPAAAANGSAANGSAAAQPKSDPPQSDALTPEQSPRPTVNSLPRQTPQLPNSNSMSETTTATDEDVSDSNTEVGQPALNFAKREISMSQTRSSYSQLSLMTANSPDQPIIPPHDYTEYDTHTDDYERICNPTCAAVRKLSAGEEIGFRQPFGDTGSHTSANSNSSAESSHLNRTSNFDSENGPHHVGQNHLPDTLSLGLNSRNSSYGSDLIVDGGSSDFLSLLRTSATRRRKYYEPARVVLHKSDSGIGSKLRTNQSDSKQNEGYFGSSIYTAPYSAGSTNSMKSLSVRSSSAPPESSIVPPSLVSSLSGSDDSLTTPIKHIREPKHPIYIPAVLRPTDFDSYNSEQKTPSIAATVPTKPTRQHWAQDRSASSCKTCNQHFTMWRRRHHCRKCGDLFCAQDSRHIIGLDRLLNFNLHGTPSRACDSCASEFAGFCLDVPRLHDSKIAAQPPLPVVEPEDADVVGGGDWSTF